METTLNKTNNQATTINGANPVRKFSTMTQAMTTATETNQNSAKALRLFQFLKEVSKLRQKTTIDINKYRDVKTVYLNDLKHESLCSTSFTDSEESHWLRLKRPEITSSPELPSTLNEWVDSSRLDDFNTEPTLNEEIYTIEPDGSEDVLYLYDHPEIEQEFEWFLEEWTEWSEERKKLEPAASAYRKLFSGINEISQTGEKLEALLGVGFLTWETADGVINHPLITVPATMQLDDSSGEITVSESDFSKGLTFNQEILPSGNGVNSQIIREIKETLEQTEDPFSSEVTACLIKWVNSVSDIAIYCEDTENCNLEVDKRPAVHCAPVVFIRPRQHLSFVNAFNSIIEKLGDSNSVPDNVMDLITATGGVEHSLESPDKESNPDMSYVDNEPFFGLPSNEEQIKIVKKLSTNRGVVVQGPPGTGKSHTIANLVTHAVAEGKRVLVTSHTSRALEVLKDKLPEEIRNLTVSLLGNGKDGSEDLIRSANELLHRMNDDADWNEDKRQERITALDKRLEKVKSEISFMRSDLGIAYEKASDEHEYAPGYSGKPGDLAWRIAEETEKFDWFEDSVNQLKPISIDEITELQSLLTQNLEEPIGMVPNTIPSITTLIEPASLSSKFKNVDELTAHKDIFALKEGSCWSAIKSASPELLTSLRNAIEINQAAIDAAGRRSGNWIEQSIKDISEGHIALWGNLERTTKEFCNIYQTSNYEWADFSELDTNELQSLLKQAKNIQKHLQTGGKITGLIKAKVVKEAKHLFHVLEKFQIEINNVDDSKQVVELLTQLSEMSKCESLWNGRLDRASESLAERRAALTDALTTLEHVMKINETRNTIDSLVGQLIADTVDTEQDVEEIKDTLHAFDMKNRYETAVEELDKIALSIVSAENLGLPSEGMQALIEAVKNRDLESYESMYENLKDFCHQVTAYSRQEELINSFSSCAPSLTGKICNQTVTDEQLYSIEEAWNWSLCKTNLLEIGDMRGEIIENLGKKVSQKRAIIGELASEHAWDHALARIDHSHEQSLRAFSLAIQNVGAGMGKMAPQFQRDAQRHLKKCETAIPVWVMPTYRIAENFEIEEEKFDLVIIDEASQSGLEAMFLFWLGKKIVVVGDDEQISPPEIGIDINAVRALQDEYLYDFELRDVLHTKNSFFDQAKVRYSGAIWLREHFRSMPEIIEFSNQLIYAPQGKRLEPLRQYGKNRLVPLKKVWVTHGDFSNNTANIAEGEEIVKAIIECHNDPSYDGKTFGVISLLSSSSQAKWIENRLLEELGPEAIRERNIYCGSSNDFQGDERDVIFLSMVKSLNADQNVLPRIGTRKSDRERYNVATTRARDQMWLFHTPSLSQLNPTCLRHKLISYFTDPPELTITPFVESVKRDEEHPRFRSLFEQRVFLDIRERGYAVSPNVRTNGREIDIVVLGAGNKLAVECDGVHFHNTETAAADSHRQTELERHGWEFFRVTDTEYYLNPNALEPLWAMLLSRNITPFGNSASFIGAAESITITPASDSSIYVENRGESEVEVLHSCKAI